MKQTRILTIVILGLFIYLTTSCAKKEEYTANITVVNKTGVDITDLTLKCKETTYSKSIAKISSGEQQNIEVKWVGRSSSFGGSIDMSYIHFTTEYSIGATKFNVENEKDAKIDSNGNYYSEKEITNGTKLNVEINENGYEITTAN